jgi:hypothetical protein
VLASSASLHSTRSPAIAGLLTLLLPGDGYANVRQVDFPVSGREDSLRSSASVSRVPATVPASASRDS